MAAQDFYETNVPSAAIDVSISTRIFQTSIIIKQDPQKSGILSFLQVLDDSRNPPAATSQAPTIRPSRQTGGY